MQPRLYTELFFLDEATACAAGHRPCHECRRGDADEFFEAWRAVHPRDRRFSEVDARLHGERTRGAHRRTACAELPYGAMVSLDGRAWLVVDDGLRGWRVTVLTPPSTLAAMRTGWRPAVHPSATVSTAFAHGSALASVASWSCSSLAVARRYRGNNPDSRCVAVLIGYDRACGTGSMSIRSTSSSRNA
jgi:hypothetical protein